MQSGTFEKVSGEFEVDESFIGGLARYMHKDKKAKITGTGGAGKAIVMGILDRKTKKIRLAPRSNTQRETLQSVVREYVEGGSYIFSDAWVAYNGLDREYIHQVIDHAEKYVDGEVHTNGIENFWTLLKRGLKGTYISVEPFHLFRYLDEQAFRFNNRKATDGERFTEALSSVVGKRLTYEHLTGKDARSAIVPFISQRQGRGKRGKLRSWSTTPSRQDELSPFERLKRFARAIVAVPKAEIAEQEAEYSVNGRTKAKRVARPEGRALVYNARVFRTEHHLPSTLWVSHPLGPVVSRVGRRTKRGLFPDHAVSVGSTDGVILFSADSWEPAHHVSYPSLVWEPRSAVPQAFDFERAGTCCPFSLCLL